MLGTTYPVTQCHIPEDLNRQRRRSNNLKSCRKQNMISEYTKQDLA